MSRVDARRLRYAADVAAVRELEVALAGAEARAGLVPVGARRARTPAEVASGADFAAHEAGVHAVAEQMLARLVGDRRRLLELLAVELGRRDGTGAAARDALFDLALPTGGLLEVPGVRELVAGAIGYHRAALLDAAALGARMLRQEAARQGVTLPRTRALAGEREPIPPEGPYRRQAAGQPVPPAAADEVDARAAHAALSPLLDMAGFLRDLALSMPVTGYRWGTFIDRVLEAGADRSTAGLATDHARVPAQQAWGIGRRAELADVSRLQQPGYVYASELNDRNTCGPCDQIDGRRFPSVDVAEAEYPAGTYRLCDGGPRCRGTLVIVWSREAPPSV